MEFPGRYSWSSKQHKSINKLGFSNPFGSVIVEPDKIEISIYFYFLF